MGQMSIAKCLSYWVERKPDGPAVTDDSGTLSFRDLDRSSNRLARVYESLGVQVGDYVTIALPNGIEFVQVALAIWKMN